MPLIGSLASIGRADSGAAQLADSADRMARAITYAPERARALSALAATPHLPRTCRPCHPTGRSRRARSAITEPADQAWALSGLADALAESGQTDRAEAMARAITGPAERARTLGTPAVTLARHVQADQATRLPNKPRRQPVRSPIPPTWPGH